jgi:hypothetical protein
MNGTQSSAQLEKKMNKQLIFWSAVGAGTILFWCCVALSIVLYQNRATINRTFKPHPYLPPPDGVSILEETFDSNENNWRDANGRTVPIQDGKLILKSAYEDMPAITRCFQCDYLGSSFFFQAELVPEEATNTEYGLVFCASGFPNEYYTFMINPQYSTYNLYKSRKDEWQNLTVGRLSPMLKAYPEANTLAVQFDQGKMDFYINGSLENSFSDPEPYSCKWPGIIVKDENSSLQVDNVFAFSLPAIQEP